MRARSQSPGPSSGRMPMPWCTAFRTRCRSSYPTGDYADGSSIRAGRARILVRAMPAFSVGAAGLLSYPAVLATHRRRVPGHKARAVQGVTTERANSLVLSCGFPYSRRTVKESVMAPEIPVGAASAPGPTRAGLWLFSGGRRERAARLRWSATGRGGSSAGPVALPRPHRLSRRPERQAAPGPRSARNT